MNLLVKKYFYNGIYKILIHKNKNHSLDTSNHPGHYARNHTFGTSRKICCLLERNYTYIGHLYLDIFIDKGGKSSGSIAGTYVSHLLEHVKMNVGQVLIFAESHNSAPLFFYGHAAVCYNHNVPTENYS